MDDDQEIEERAELYETLAEDHEILSERRDEEDEFRANLSTQEEVAEFENWLDGFDIIEVEDYS